MALKPSATGNTRLRLECECGRRASFAVDSALPVQQAARQKGWCWHEGAMVLPGVPGGGQTLMCAISHPIEQLCRHMADLEFELEQRLCEATDMHKQELLAMLRRRGDTRAADILNAYLKPSAATVDAALASLVE
jgi:hypothetical protein